MGLRSTSKHVLLLTHSAPVAALKEEQDLVDNACSCRDPRESQRDYE